MPATGLGKLLKWLGAPLLCAAVGYFVVAPRMVKKHPAPIAERSAAKVESAPPMPDVTETSPPAKEDVQPETEHKAADDASGKVTPVPPSPNQDSASPASTDGDKPVLEVTTDRPKPRVAPIVRKKAKKKKPAVTTPVTATDPASNAAPAEATDKPGQSAGEPPATP